MDSISTVSTEYSESSQGGTVPTVILLKKLHTLIGTVKEIKPVTTYDEVLEGMKKYIVVNQLYDQNNPAKVYCDDELRSVLGVEEFVITQVKDILRKLLIPVNLRKDSAEGTSSAQCDNILKRRFDESFEGDQRKVFVADVIPHSASPMKLYIPPTPESCYNESDTAESVQGYETAYAKDTSDTNLSFGDNCQDIFTVEETFDIEYEVESSSSSDVPSSDSSGSESEVDSEVVLNAAILTFLCKTDSDIEFFADASSDEGSDDVEISECDQWECNVCHSLNRPPMRRCSRCWEQRLEWLPDKQNEHRIPPRNKRRQKKLAEKDFIDSIEASVAQCCDPESEGSSRVSSESQENPSQSSSDACSSDITSAAKLCIICCSKPANASIVHGKYAHQCTCYRCARTLAKQKKRCPICRRTIDRVVHQICS